MILAAGITLFLWSIIAPYVRANTKATWAAITLGMALVFFGLTGYFLEKPPLNMFIMMEPKNYPNGFEVNDVKWSDQFSVARVHIFNNSDNYYNNIGLLIQ